MASQNLPSSQSRLSQMQMRFQQKQLLEREKRKLDLSATIHSDTTAATGIPANDAAKAMGNGKVRQMFDERRRGAGIDRSYPLKPIAKTVNTRTEPAAEDSLANKARSMQRRNVTVSNLKRTPGPERNNNMDRGSLSKSLSKLSLQDINTAPGVTAGGGDRNNNKEINAAVTARRAAPTNSIRLKPVVVRKAQNSPPATTMTAPRSQTATPLSSARGSASSPRTPAPYAKTPNKLAPKTSTGKITLSVKPPPRVITPPPGMATCQFCSRNFIEDRLAKHQQICQKMMTKQRKIFDATKQRVRGTEVEPYVKRQMKSGGSIAAKTPTSTLKQTSNKKSNWRQKHEEFLAAVRNARKLQAHLAKGGKITDLPPPPPSENPDYVQCPHCNRRFNEAAAERHIPKCANIQHNKPKPGQNIKKR